MFSDELAQQMRFIAEADKLKQVLRHTLLKDGARRENSAEHSWHLALMVIVLADYAPPNVDFLRAIKQVVIHDLVEIYAGDTYCFDLEANRIRPEIEAQAAIRLFNILPGEQGNNLLELWHEFEDCKTPTAKFATAVDRLQPFLQSYPPNEQAWFINGISREQFLERMLPIQEGLPILWPKVLNIINDCIFEC